MKDVLQGIIPRKYQIDIAKTCETKNTLVVLPTGLGKTLIALIAAIERIKKFPTKKVLILAPTKPLAQQHIKSFKEKIPELWCEIELFTGNVKAEKRKKIWNTADIVFSTPQCIANDLKNGLYNLRDVSLLVQDEVHRCVKNYDYTYIAKRYVKEAEEVRVIGLTASPGSEYDKIKEIGANLSIQAIELRTRESPDVKEFLQKLEFEKREIELTKRMTELSIILKNIYDRYVDDLRYRGFLFGNDNKFSLIKLQGKIAMQLKNNITSPESFIAMSACAQAIRISHAIELLETQTIESFSKYLENLQDQANKKKSRGVVALSRNPEFQKARSFALILKEKGLEHPKVEEVIRVVRDEKKKDPNFKAIIFTHFRETANIVSRNLNKLGGIKSSVFVGQAKKDGHGMTQKEQKKMIEDFSSGDINILVATCIAEEGLDIPEVNAVVFYEPVSSAIRSIQRRGRTARLTKGKLIMLITKGTKDEFAHYSSRSRERKMTEVIEKLKLELMAKGTLSEDKFIQKKLF